jgi:3-deoxy-D-manno-octulosonic-acid transferase
MELARTLYSLVGVAASPLIPLRLWWRGRREPGYRQAVGERFGRYAKATPSAPIYWVHAVSVGETRAAVPLIERLRGAFPDATILLTHMTATGRETGKVLFGDHVVQAWLPYDLPFAVDAFFSHFRPLAGFLLETELWPNVIAEAAARRVPMFLINARLSARSAAGYARVPALSRPMFARLDGVAAQSADDASRLAALGAPAPVVTGNLKFDVRVPEVMRAMGMTLREHFGTERRVWVAASTRDGEEALILDALARAPSTAQDLLVIVPRHPQRFDAVAALLQARNIAFVRRSTGTPVPANVRVVLGDSMGEMLAYYAASDLVFVGGSLLPFGAHTLIEPIAMGAPILIGPHTFNFAEVTEGAITAGAAIRISDADALIAGVAALFADGRRRRAMADAALAFHALHQGAADRMWSWLVPQLKTPVRSPDRD